MANTTTGLSLATILEKNKLQSDGAWLVLLEIQFSGVSLRLVRSTAEEGIEWNGHKWASFPFELDDINDDAKATNPSVTIKVGNQTRTAQRYADMYNGGVDAVVYIRVVHENHLDIVEPDLELEFVVTEAESDDDWVYFTLGTDDADDKRFPEDRILKDWCPYAFKSIRCGYNGSAAPCTHTLASCKALGNGLRFGGEFSLPVGGIYASNS